MALVDFDSIESDSERINFIESIGNLISNGQVTPEALNEGLANYFSINRFLVTIYEQVVQELEETKIQYDMWYSELFIQEKAKLNDGRPQSKFASQAEINSAVIVNNQNDYKEKKYEILQKERRVSFYRRLLDSWKVQSNILINLSQNMRSELMALSVENRANKDITKENLIRHNKEGLGDNIRVKKIKRVESE